MVPVKVFITRKKWTVLSGGGHSSIKKINFDFRGRLLNKSLAG